jgi:hypothetical protein
MEASDYGGGNQEEFELSRCLDIIITICISW